MATSTSHSVKRAFRHTPKNDATPHGPILPATIQTSLLSVGMRIRKSVVEGTSFREALFRFLINTSVFEACLESSFPQRLPKNRNADTESANKAIRILPNPRKQSIKILPLTSAMDASEA